LPLAIEKRPDHRGQCGDDEQDEHDHPIEGSIAAASVCVRDRMGDAQNVGSNPKDDRTNWAERLQVWNINLGNRNQAAEDLRRNAEQAEVHEAKPESYAGGKTPARRLLFPLDLRVLGQNAYPTNAPANCINECPNDDASRL
jgi:hypothetical protein